MLSEETKLTNVHAMEAALSASLGSSTKINLAVPTSLARITPIVGAWYFSIKCDHCTVISPALRDESNGQRGNPFTGIGLLSLICPRCGEDAAARVEDIIVQQWMG